MENNTKNKTNKEVNFSIQGTKPPAKERNEIKNNKEEQFKNGKGE